jgi:hypothetical protein
MLGGLEEETKMALFIETKAATNLVNQYVNNQNMMNRKLALELLVPLLSNESASLQESSRQVAIFLVNFGGI